MIFSDLFSELFAIVLRSVSGKLLTQSQIKNVTGNVIGRYFADWFPTPADEKAARDRVAAAQNHISEAGRIITTLRNDLDLQLTELESLSREVDEKRIIAERYETLARTNQETLSAFKAEMEAAIRQELVAQANKGKRVRQVASGIAWLITLVAGAALGAYFPDLVKLVRGDA